MGPLPQPRRSDRNRRDREAIQAAALYRDAVRNGEKPGPYVARQMRLSDEPGNKVTAKAMRRAYRLINEARALGELPETDRGRKTTPEDLEGFIPASKEGKRR